MTLQIQFNGLTDCGLAILKTNWMLKLEQSYFGAKQGFR